MSYFSTEKRLNMSIQTLHTNSIQTLGSVYEDLNIFIPSQVPQITQFASSVGYPTITTTSSPSTIVLESGWKYVIEFKVKATDTSPAVTENITYIATDTSNNQISNTGSLLFYRDTAYGFVQEKCIFYVDSLSNSTTFKLRALKTSGAGGGINVTGDTGSANFKCYLLIKAWK